MKEVKEIIAQVRKIDIATRGLVEGLLSGNYHSVFKGQGIEFSEIRDYKAGDDVRSIDWNVTARFNHPFVKEFIEERDLSVYFVLDVSGSVDFGNLKSKKRKALELIASLMFAAARNGDKVGVGFATDKIERFVPAKRGKRHVLRLLSDMVGFEGKSRGTDLGACLREVGNVLKRRSVVFVVSDFIGGEMGSALKGLRKRHDVIAINVRDDREGEIPDIGLIELEDEETGEQILVDTSSKEFRENYEKVVGEDLDGMRVMFRKLKIDCLDVGTSEDYVVLLRRFFRMRKDKR